MKRKIIEKDVPKKRSKKSLEATPLPSKIGPYKIKGIPVLAQKRTASYKPGVWFVDVESGETSIPKVIKGPYPKKSVDMVWEQLFFDSVKRHLKLKSLGAEYAIENEEYFIIMDCIGHKDYPVEEFTNQSKTKNHRTAPKFSEYLHENKMKSININSTGKDEIFELLKIIVLRYLFGVRDTGFHSILFMPKDRTFVSIDEESIFTRFNKDNWTMSKKVKKCYIKEYNQLFRAHKAELIELIDVWERFFSKNWAVMVLHDKICLGKRLDGLRRITEKAEKFVSLLKGEELFY